MIRTRIAPTPSGYLHIGNALNFIIIWLWVRRAGGKLLLRIDDRDTPRAKPEFIGDIFRSLEWLGIDWDEGPQTPDELHQKYSQALRSERYEALTQQLITTGKVYACECSRREMHAQHCACRAKNIPLNKPDTALRIITPTQPVIVHDLQQANKPISLDPDLTNFIIRRRDGITAYQLVSLADDIDYNINLIIRGEDLLGSTAAQLYLASVLGNTNFALTNFYHHTMVHDEQGNKLSKSSGSISLHDMRQSGVAVKDVYLKLSTMLGWKQKCSSAAEMLQSGQSIISTV